MQNRKTFVIFKDTLIDYDIKKFIQDIQTEICYNLPTAFWHRNQHIIQVLCKKEFNEKNNCTTFIVSFMIYEWIDISFGLTNIPSRPQNIVNDIFTPFIVISNTYIKDVLIKEVSQLLLESPLFRIKESINCGNFLNEYRTNRVNYKSLTYFPLTEIVINNNERIDEVTLFNTSWQKQVYIIDRTVTDFIPLSYYNIDRLYHDSYTITQQN